MVSSPLEWLREQVKNLALSKPRLMTVVVFFFLYTVSNSVHFATSTVLKMSPFWQMLVMGAVLATFTSLLIYARISDLAVVPYRQDQSLRLEFWGSDVRNHTTEGDTRWVNYNTSHSSSRSTAS